MNAGLLMTLRIEFARTEDGSRLFLIGELRRDQIKEVQTEISRRPSPVTLDLHELALVDVDVIRFLNTCETQSVAVVNSSSFIREWMLQELKTMPKPGRAPS